LGGIRRLAVALACCAACVVVISACGSSTSSTSSSGSTSSTAGKATAPGKIAAPAGDAAALKLVPAALKDDYFGVSTFAKVGPNPYADWTPPKPPWKFCLSAGYLKNSFRQEELKSQYASVAKLQAEGLAKGGLTVLDSNGDVNLQGSQINQLVAKGCNVIMALPVGPTGYCSAVDNARDHNVLFFTVNASSDCKNAVGSAENSYTLLRDGANWLAQQMGGKGTLVMMEGLRGSAINAARMEAAKAVFDSYPDIKVQGTIDGEYTPTVAKTAALKYLATHPGKIDAVFDSGAMATAAAQAFKQTGRPAPKQNNFAADCSWLAYWKENNLTSSSYAEGPRATDSEAYHLAVRMLKGDKPALNTFVYPLPLVNNDNLDQWYKPDMTVDSGCFAEPSNGREVADSYWAPMFDKGS
jgi:ribose transport system substrate-binding protein